MPIFYNTSEPTPGNKNTITDIATNFGIRDFLLNKKLQPRYPQISTNVNGSPRIGEPVLDTVVGTNSNITPDFSPIEEYSANNAQDSFGRNTFRPDQDTRTNPYVTVDYIQDINNPQFGDAEWPHGTQQYPESATDEVSQYGIIGKTNNAGYREFNTAKNEYLDASEQTDAQIQTESQITKQINGYLNEYGALNLGQGGAVQASNVIGSLLNGQGLGFSNEGLVTNFDLRSTLAGRALGLTGVLNDTELGIIGAQQLAVALGNNAAFNVQQEILGSLNVGENILNLIKEGTSPVFRPNYKITVPGDTLGRVADYTSRILGFTLPKSYLQDSGSIFQYENGNSENIARANAMLDNTGKGQIKALITNVNGSLQGIYGIDNPSLATFRSGYAAGYTNDRDIKSNDYNIYAYYNGNGTLINPLSINDRIIPDLNYNKRKIDEYGFYGFEDVLPNITKYNGRTPKTTTFTWVSDNQSQDTPSPLQTGPLNRVNDSTTTIPFLPVSNVFPDEYNGKNLKKTLLKKTQKLFNSSSNRNIVSVKGDTELRDSTQISTANGNATSKGSAVLKSGQFTNYTFNGVGGSADDIFCRSWVATNRYDSIGNLIRRSALLKDNMPYRNDKFNPNLSVLEDTGFVKIAPYTSDFDQNGPIITRKANVKNYMFSIENLAWNDNYPDLPAGERGPGDTTTNRKGRIMWFPPYDINFSESVSVQWESTNFIGRGEPIYTYNNTERTGTLSFSIIVDHPTYANAFKNKNNRPDDNYIASFFAGCCILPDETLTNELIATKIREKITQKTEQTQNSSATSEEQKTASEEKVPMNSFKIYFPNDYPSQNDINVSVDKILNGGIGSTTNKYESGFNLNTPIDYTINAAGVEGYPPGVNDPTSKWGGIGNFDGGYTSNTDFTDKTNFGLNGVNQKLSIDGKPYTLQDPNFFTDLKKHLDDKCKTCTITIQGFATIQGGVDKEKGNRDQTELTNYRSQAVEYYLKNTVGITNDIKIISGQVVESESCKPKITPTNLNPTRPDAKACKEGRYVTITFNTNPEKASEEVKPDNTTTTTTTITETIKDTDGRYNFYNELNFFEKLEKGDCNNEGGSFIFDSFREKIKYFHPAFHSTTPEGLNSRLTFLHQCTRQGATKEEQGADNLAFGRAPICILRIGDFFHTKIAIDSLSIDYEPLVWDLNPEGIGVQPMIAKVTLGLKIIGGSSLNGPLNKLQNALSFNYYANTEVYDPRADYIEIDTSGNGTIKNGIKNANDSFEPFSTTDDKFKGGSGSGSDIGKSLSYNPSNQTQEADKQLNGEVPSQSGTTSEPKITRIQEADWLIEQSNITNLLVKIKLESQNIFDANGNFVTGMNDDKFNKLIKKGVNITINEEITYPDPNQITIFGEQETNITDIKTIYSNVFTDSENIKKILLNGNIIEIINKDTLENNYKKDYKLIVKYNNNNIGNKNLTNPFLNLK